MDILSDILIGIGLAMDCAAVSVAGGAAAEKQKKSVPKAALLAGAYFGVFQGLMLALGWLGGSGIRDFVSGIDHWIAFGLLGFIGAKMLVESFGGDGQGKKKIDLLAHDTLAVLAFATSIDAFVVGAGLAFTDSSIALSAIIVGITTAAISMLSAWLGSRHHKLFGNRIEILGGLILLGIGARILFSHLAGAG